MSSSSWGLCCVALARQTCVRFPIEDLYCCCGRLRLEAHPLAHASGWDLSGGGGGGASARAPSLGGRKWQKENDKLEKQLEVVPSIVFTSLTSKPYALQLVACCVFVIVV